MSGATIITRTHVLWALLCLTLALMPHASRFSPWLLICFGALALWRVLAELGRLPLPDRRHFSLWILKQVLAVAAFIAIYISYQGQLGRDAGVALLSALLGLKMLELHNERDFYVVMFLGYFLVVTNFFYSQTLATALFMLIVVVMVTGGLIRFNASSETISTRHCIQLACAYVAQAIPFMVAGFFLFPRIPGPLWGIPQDANTAITGLSEEMTIGHITELGVSDKVAFRVAFDGDTPPAQDLYWRGLVLWHTDGRSWRAGRIGDGHARAIISGGRAYRYMVTIEPHNKRWLFGLEAVTNTGDSARQTSDHRLLARHPVKRRLRYSLESRTQFALMEITESERRAALELPPGSHPRARRLAADWRNLYPADDTLIKAALLHFNREPSSYTLTPRRLHGDPIDQFLFDTREENLRSIFHRH